MYCPKCGKNISSSKFCPYCGAAADQAISSQNETPSPDQQPTYQPPQPHTPSPSVPPAPTPYVPYQTTPPKKKGGCLKVGLIVLGVIVVLGVIGSIFGGGGNIDPDKNVSSTNESSQISSSTPSSEAPSSSEEKKESFGVGETAESGGVKMTLMSITESAGSKYIKPNDGYVFLQCNFEIDNSSDKDLSISSILCFETYVDGYSTSQSITGLLNSDGGKIDQLDGSVAAGKKMKGTIAYEVPKDWKEIEIRVNPDVLSFFSSEVTFKAIHE
ncbi:DUF4352 domain-containing protein [Anaeromassilibacillus senegalensis]|uniref:DUF4352 domain-containing protein n=1 Tax=Anaeromassilibacillus senegalensis TaxID=1673717 RepID=UPI000ABE2C72|nr:DUF4352 domain-containing protein [Anaeromassilibacillus senegalensis]